MTGDEWLTGPQAAQRIGVTAATWRSYVARGYAPRPDDPDSDRPPNRRQPRWLVSTVDAYAVTRPGTGARTDLAMKEIS